ncbi:hypothetical protein Pla110_45020 [Polystyrenella longa]|uniref:Uncharacterized protein n=1 Tax=Polystyrenella longa TaxID=2528007 RepID=A0A518CU28_9PLAN|nr:hypothetical protein Pla110_45020 [Polystyrenella longa]
MDGSEGLISEPYRTSTEFDIANLERQRPQRKLPNATTISFNEKIAYKTNDLDGLIDSWDRTSQSGSQSDVEIRYDSSQIPLSYDEVENKEALTRGLFEFYRGESVAIEFLLPRLLELWEQPEHYEVIKLNGRTSFSLKKQRFRAPYLIKSYSTHNPQGLLLIIDCENDIEKQELRFNLESYTFSLRTKSQ